MNFSEAATYLYSLGHETLAMKLGLETVRKLAGACDEPQRKFPAIHIAGTNGKGSTSAMVESVLRSAGICAGLFTSPHLVSITERVRVNGEQITEDDFARLATDVRATSERLVAEGVFEAPPTFFEQVTMIAYLYFAERAVELAVLEVGMGGRLDATNICKPLVTVITPIDYDHQKYLGNSLAEIAREKAGIIKSGVPVIVARQSKEAMGAIVARSKELGAPITAIEGDQRTGKLIWVERVNDGSDIWEIGKYRFRYQTASGDYDIRLNLRGRHQVTNALTAIKIAEQLADAGWDIAGSAIIEGLGKTEWSGRLEMLRISNGAERQLPVLIDGAHNRAGARALSDFLTEHFSSIPITLIFGVMADKAIEEMGEILFPPAHQIVVTKINNPRAAETVRIAEVAERLNANVKVTGSVDEALAEALRITPEGGLICACGSLYLAGEIKSLTKIERSICYQ